MLGVFSHNVFENLRCYHGTLFHINTVCLSWPLEHLSSIGWPLSSITLLQWFSWLVGRQRWWSVQFQAQCEACTSWMVLSFFFLKKMHKQVFGQMHFCSFQLLWEKKNIANFQVRYLLESQLFIWSLDGCLRRTMFPISQLKKNICMNLY